MDCKLIIVHFELIVIDSWVIMIAQVDIFKWFFNFYDGFSQGGEVFVNIKH
jgi:hypothetical protein